MSEHFVGKYEAEIKFILKNPDIFLSTILTDNAQPFTVNNSETDDFFDYPDMRLTSQNISMSVREMTPSGIKLWIVKGPTASECKAIDIDDCQHVKNMLTTLGYNCYLTITKHRSIYFLQDIHITIDHLAGVGWFAEFAIMTNDESQLDFLYEQLMTAAKKYGFNETLIEHRSYKQIYLENQAD